MRIRRADPSEYDEVTRVWMAGWQSTGLGHAEDSSFEELQIKFRQQVATVWDLYVAEVDGRIAGLLALQLAQSQLDQLFLHPDFQGQGIGLALLNHAKDILPHGMWLRSAEKNYRAIRFYEKSGFKFERRDPRPEFDRFDVTYRWSPA